MCQAEGRAQVNWCLGGNERISLGQGSGVERREWGVLGRIPGEISGIWNMMVI